MVTRALYLLRHAKSSWDDAALADHERPLAPRGRRACELVADYVRRREISPALVLCSSSTRTRETLARVSVGFAYPFDVLIEDGLYGASVDDLLARLRAVDGSVASVMLIGHDPAIHELALSLAGSGPRHEVLSDGFPTGALATLSHTGGWGALEPGAAALTDFVKPRELKGRAGS